MEPIYLKYKQTITMLFKMKKFNLRPKIKMTTKSGPQNRTRQIKLLVHCLLLQRQTMSINWIKSPLTRQLMELYPILKFFILQFRITQPPLLIQLGVCYHRTIWIIKQALMDWALYRLSHKKWYLVSMTTSTWAFSPTAKDYHLTF